MRPNNHTGAICDIPRQFAAEGTCLCLRITRPLRSLARLPQAPPISWEQHTLVSIPSLSRSPLARPPSSSSPRLPRAGRRGSARREALGWTAGSCGSGAPGTSCLGPSVLSLKPSLQPGSQHPLFSTSKQMRPNLSTFGWKILVRKRILGGAIG